VHTDLSIKCCFKLWLPYTKATTGKLALLYRQLESLYRWFNWYCLCSGLCLPLHELHLC